MDLSQPVLIEQQYWGSISWFNLLLQAKAVTFDLHEHYRKGTYRNRCHIMGPNGLLQLSVPLIKGKFQHTSFGKVRISYSENWRKDHWMSLVSSYRRSAYFEYYEEVLAPIYQEEFEFLYQVNDATLAVVKQILSLDLAPNYTDKYHDTDWTGADARNWTHPNAQKQQWSLKGATYPQVFMDRMPFMPDLCVLDVIFNLGPRALSILQVK